MGELGGIDGRLRSLRVLPKLLLCGLQGPPGTVRPQRDQTQLRLKPLDGQTEGNGGTPQLIDEEDGIGRRVLEALPFGIRLFDFFEPLCRFLQPVGFVNLFVIAPNDLPQKG